MKLVVNEVGGNEIGDNEIGASKNDIISDNIL
jgi:hypothetical protein